VLGCARHLSTLLLHAAEAILINPSVWKEGLGSSAILALFVAIGADAPVGSVGKG
jgi:hypothetical protein